MLKCCEDCTIQIDGIPNPNVTRIDGKCLCDSCYYVKKLKGKENLKKCVNNESCIMESDGYCIYDLGCEHQRWVD